MVIELYVRRLYELLVFYSLKVLMQLILTIGNQLVVDSFLVWGSAIASHSIRVMNTGAALLRMIVSLPILIQNITAFFIYYMADSNELPVESALDSSLSAILDILELLLLSGVFGYLTGFFFENLSLVVLFSQKFMT